MLALSGANEGGGATGTGKKSGACKPVPALVARGPAGGESSVDVDHPLDLEARERGTSIYLPEHRLPMFPEEISEDLLSLLAHQERLALSFLVTLDPQGEIRDWTIFPSRIKVQQRLTYHEVESLLAQDQKLAAISQ